MSDRRSSRLAVWPSKGVLCRLVLPFCLGAAAVWRLSAAEATGVAEVATNAAPSTPAGTSALPVSTNAPAAPTNAAPKFAVRAYEITGDTLLSTEALTTIFARYTGTNIGVAEIMKAGSDLQLEYRDRGFPTVNVTIPPQQISNGIVKIRVFEGFVSDIVVTNNRWYSSSNVMRALPSLRTGVVLVRPVFQAELDRANANQDRQIYPQLEPGPRTNTSRLILDVKDRLPLHAKVELNNQSSPGTPDLRVNTSAAFNNLWQREHSVGFQYSFSPEDYKAGNQWAIYDRPLVANYSVFYRMPLGDPEIVAEAVHNNPGSFGYDEATRRFRLPASSGRPEMTVYASRSTIDTGVEILDNQTILDNPGVRTVTKTDVQKDVTLNDAIGIRLTRPLQEVRNIRSALSGGMDFKMYDLTDNKTNNFKFSEITRDPNGNLNPPTVYNLPSPVPTTHRPLNYMPVSLRYDASLRDPSGKLTGTLGLGVSVNAWYSGTASNFHNVSGSSKTSGHWVALTPGASADLQIHKDWTLSLRVDGQWASEPLISNEQFGAGGIASVRGYREGEVFGDSGWHTSLELKTPLHTVGAVQGSDKSRGKLLTVRGSVYMDNAEVFLIDPQGRAGPTPLSSAGCGGVVSIGTHWEGRLLFSWPFLSAGTTRKNEPRFDFALTAQF